MVTLSTLLCPGLDCLPRTFLGIVVSMMVEVVTWTMKNTWTCAVCLPRTWSSTFTAGRPQLNIPVGHRLEGC